MPTYQYRCECGRTVERSHSSEKRLKVTCELCGGQMQWQFPCPYIQTDTTFLAGVAKNQRKGSGFYSHQLQRVVYGRDDIKKELHTRGWGSEDFNIEPRLPDKDPFEKPYKVSPAIVERRIADKEEERGVPFTPKERAKKTEQLSAELSGNP